MLCNVFTLSSYMSQLQELLMPECNTIGFNRLDKYSIFSAWNVGSERVHCVEQKEEDLGWLGS